MAQCSLVLSFLSFFCFFISPREDQTERKAYHRFKERFLNSLCMSIKRVPLFEKIKWADKRRQGTLPVFCILSSSLWASLMCLPQSLFWLPSAVSFSPLHWRGFWLTKIKHELLELLLATLNTDRRCASFPALYTHQGCTASKKCISDANITQNNYAISRCAAALVQITILLWTVKAEPESVLRGCSPPSRLLLVINVCTDSTPYFKGLLTQQRVDLFSTRNLLIRTITCNFPACEKAPFYPLQFQFFPSISCIPTGSWNKYTVRFLSTNGSIL